MKICFVFPAIGKKPGERYIRTWRMEPLPIAVLSALTPPQWERVFFDDRLEQVDYEIEADLVALSVETYTAKRAYQMADRFRARGRRVVLGGYHVTHLPHEALRHADAVVTGNAETVWAGLLEDAHAGRLRQVYAGEVGGAGPLPDRKIYADKHYLRLGLVETGRGCHQSCDFCNITSFYHAHYHPRPLADILTDIETCGRRQLFFVDDNLASRPDHLRELCAALKPLGVRWAAQGSLTLAKDPGLLRDMRQSGCVNLLVGFESIVDENLHLMKKGWSVRLGDRDELVRRIHDSGIPIYATFLVGYDHDTPDTVKRTLDFAQRHHFFYAAFNHLLPFPGTPLLDRLRAEGRMLHDPWWLADGYRYGSLAFKPRLMSPEQVEEGCLDARRQFFGLSSILSRGWNLIKRGTTPIMLPIYLQSNLNLKDEVGGKFGLPVGEGLDEMPK